MAASVDFQMRRILDDWLKQLGTAGAQSNRRILDITSYGFSVNTVDLHLSSAATTDTLDEDKVWVQSSLVKVPYSSITRGQQGLNHKKSLYTILIKSPKEMGEYLNEAVSAEVENYFDFNRHILDNGQIFTLLETHQQPTVYLDGNTGRYWNRVFVNCEAYFTNN